jgi:hypothetical protein
LPLQTNFQMTVIRPQKKRWKKPLLIGGFLTVVAIAVAYWIVATEKFSDTSSRKAAYTVNATDLIREFKQNDSAANAKYTDKIITVTGTVSALEAPDSTTVNIKMEDPETKDIILFAFQEQHLEEGKMLKVGDLVSIKGSCSGGSIDGILELLKIEFKRSALNKN